MRSFQQRVSGWMLSCFNADIAKNKKERAFRFLEEALELVQAIDCTKEEATKLVEYVFDRPAGRPAQEVGGTLVCIAALCNACGIVMDDAGEDELERIWDIKDKIRQKWNQKEIRCGVRGSNLVQDPLP